MHNKDECRLILIGATGSGKSATGNTLLGRAAFRTGHSFASSTQECCVATATRLGVTFKVVDTPGFYDSEDYSASAIEIVRSLYLVEPGPHALLFVSPLSKRFTEDQYDNFQVIRNALGDEISRHLVLIFTHGDCLADEETTFSTLIETASTHMVRILEECKFRYTIIDNTSTDTQQVKCLIDILKQVKNQAGHFSSLLTKLPEEQLAKELNYRIKQAREQENRREETVVELQKLTDKIEGTIKNLDELKDRQQRLIRQLLGEENFETRRLEAVKKVKEKKCSVTEEWNGHAYGVY